MLVDIVFVDLLFVVGLWDVVIVVLLVYLVFDVWLYVELLVG